MSPKLVLFFYAIVSYLFFKLQTQPNMLKYENKENRMETRLNQCNNRVVRELVFCIYLIISD